MIIGISLCLVSCSGKIESMNTPLDFVETVQSTDLSSETGELESLNASEQTIIEQRGEPLQRGRTDREEVVLEYLDFQYILADDRVVSYSVKPGQMTAKQVKIGDDEERVIDAYGNDFYTREQDALSIKGYVDKGNQKVIEFLLEQNIVKMIFVSELSLFK